MKGFLSLVLLLVLGGVAYVGLQRSGVTLPSLSSLAPAPRCSDLHVIVDTSGSLPPASQAAVRAKVRDIVADEWASQVLPGDSLTVWAFDESRTAPIVAVYSTEVTVDQLRPPVVKSRPALGEKVARELDASLGTAPFDRTVSPVVESVAYLANAAPSGSGHSIDVVIVSDFLQTSPKGGVGLVLSESVLREHDEEGLLGLLRSTETSNPSIRKVTMASTYGMSDCSTGQGVPPELHAKVVKAFQRWFEGMGCEVALDPVMPGTAQGAAAAE